MYNSCLSRTDTFGQEEQRLHESGFQNLAGGGGQRLWGSTVPMCVAHRLACVRCLYVLMLLRLCDCCSQGFPQ
jgi:hypothetical protein